MGCFLLRYHEMNRRDCFSLDVYTTVKFLNFEIMVFWVSVRSAIIQVIRNLSLLRVRIDPNSVTEEAVGLAFFSWMNHFSSQMWYEDHGHFVLCLIYMQFISQFLYLVRTCGLGPFKVFQDLGFIAVKGFHNNIPSISFLCLLNAYYFEIDVHHCHFLTNYEPSFQVISMLLLLREGSFLFASVLFSWLVSLL